jgi:uncharacterized protein
MNDEPPVDAKNWLHHVLVALDRLSRIPSWLLAAWIGALSLTMGALWHATTHAMLVPWIAGSLYLLAAATDWVWLAALPRRGISFGPFKPSLLGLTGVRLLAGLVPLLGTAAGCSAWACSLAGGLFQILIASAVVYATGIEPFRLAVTRVEVKTAKLSPGQRVRLVQVSDLHVERITRRERELVAKVNALHADAILLTGDYLSFSYIGEARAMADARQVLGGLVARCGIYAVRGTHQIDPNATLAALFDGLPVRWLRNEHVIVSHNGSQIAFAGASCTRDRAIDVPALQRAMAGIPEQIFTVLAYHTPELVPEAAAGGADLYLAGHTHGGQIRVPFYGALLTATDVGKRYEMGRYDVHGLTLYVSRGIGMEGRGAPRARFLCPPEIVCVDVIGA